MQFLYLVLNLLLSLLFLDFQLIYNVMYVESVSIEEKNRYAGQENHQSVFVKEFLSIERRAQIRIRLTHF
jgi:hypothetical protein